MNFSHSRTVDRLDVGLIASILDTEKYPPEDIWEKLTNIDPEILDVLGDVPEEELRMAWLDQAQRNTAAAVASNIVPAFLSNLFQVADLPQSYPNVGQEDADMIDEWVRDVKHQFLQRPTMPLLTGRYRTRFTVPSILHHFPNHSSITNPLAEIISCQQISQFLRVGL
jgi:hypothetical protein